MRQHLTARAMKLPNVKRNTGRLDEQINCKKKVTRGQIPAQEYTGSSNDLMTEHGEISNILFILFYWFSFISTFAHTCLFYYIGTNYSCQAWFHFFLTFRTFHTFSKSRPTRARGLKPARTTRAFFVWGRAYNFDLPRYCKQRYGKRVPRPDCILLSKWHSLCLLFDVPGHSAIPARPFFGTRLAAFCFLGIQIPGSGIFKKNKTTIDTQAVVCYIIGVDNKIQKLKKGAIMINTTQRNLTGIDIDTGANGAMRLYLRYDETTKTGMIKGQHCDVGSDIGMLLLDDRDALKAKIKALESVCAI